MADRFPIILNTSANQLQEMPAGDTLDISDAAIKTNLVDSKSVVGTGVSIVGVVTATSFVGSGANLSGIDITAVKDSGGNVKIQAQDSGAIYTGIHTFGSTTSFTSGVFNGTVTSTGAVVNGDSDLNGDLDVDGHTNLDNVSVAGVTTATGTLNSTGGIILTANMSVASDTAKVFFGASNDLEVYHNGSHSFLKNLTGNLEILGDNLRFRNAAANKNSITVNNNQDVTLWYNGNSKLSTTSTGINVLGTIVGDGLTIDGDSDLNGDIDVDGHTNLDNVSVAGVTTFAGAINGSSAAFTGNVSVGGVLTYEDVKNVDSVGVATARTGLKVLAGGANVVGVVTASNGIFVPDNQGIHLGNVAGGGDLNLSHNGSHSYIKDSGTGSLLIQGSQVALQSTSGENMVTAAADGAVQIMYDLSHIHN